MESLAPSTQQDNPKAILAAEQPKELVRSVLILRLSYGFPPPTLAPSLFLHGIGDKNSPQ